MIVEGAVGGEFDFTRQLIHFDVELASGNDLLSETIGIKSRCTLLVFLEELDERLVTLAFSICQRSITCLIFRKKRVSSELN